MGKNLPNVFQVPIEKEIKNNEEIYESDKKEKAIEETISKTEINKIFNSINHVYKTRVRIKTHKEIKEVDAVGLTNNNLLTLKGETIPIDDILEIKKV